MAEWFKATVLKTVIPSDRDRGFESLSLLQKTHYKIILAKRHAYSNRKAGFRGDYRAIRHGKDLQIGDKRGNQLLA